MPVSSTQKFKYVGIVQRLSDKQAIYLVTNSMPNIRKAHIAMTGKHNMDTCQFAQLPRPMLAKDAYQYADEQIGWDLNNPPWATNNGAVVSHAGKPQADNTVLRTAKELAIDAEHSLSNAQSRRDTLKHELAGLETEIKLLEAMVQAIPKEPEPKQIRTQTKQKDQPAGHA